MKIPPIEVLPPTRATPEGFEGAWRITEMEVWGADYIDLIVPGHITFNDESMGTFQFGAVKGWLDCRWVERDGKRGVEFSWEGENDRDDACGRGWAPDVDDDPNAVRSGCAEFGRAMPEASQRPLPCSADHEYSFNEYCVPASRATAAASSHSGAGIAPSFARVWRQCSILPMTCSSCCCEGWA